MIPYTKSPFTVPSSTRPALASVALGFTLLSPACDGGGPEDGGLDGGDAVGIAPDDSGNASTGGTTGMATSGGFDPTIEPSSGTGGTGGTDDSAGETGGKACMEEDLIGVIKPPNVLLVLDKSGSMKTEWDDGKGGGDKVERWVSLYDTVEFMLDNYMQRMNFSVKLFPGRDAEEVGENACIVDDAIDVKFGSTNKFQILSKIPGKDDDFEGGTPAATALEHGVAYMRQVKELDPFDLPQAIILVMDGRVTCGQDMQDMRELAEEAVDDAVPVYVVGVDIANDADDPGLPREMDDLAAAGATGMHYASNNEEQLRLAMEKIVGKITECNFSLASTPLNHTLGTMTIDGQRVDWIKDHSSCESAAQAGITFGWLFTDPGTFQQVDICGGACELFADSGSADLRFKCPPM